MADGKLAILMPSYRFDETARHCIETVASMACTTVEVYVGDNSCNPEKWALLRKLAERSPHFHPYCHASNIGGDGNWRLLLAKQSHEFMCMASDDDMFSPDYFLAGLEELKSNANAAAASGMLMILSKTKHQMRVQMPLSNEKLTPVERLANYSGMSTIPYMVHRRADAMGFYDFTRDRPFWPSYVDQFMTYALLSQGTQVFKADRKLFLYNNDNWSDEETCVASDGRYYTTAGLPDGFKYLHQMFWAIEIVHYFNSKYRAASLTDHDADTIVRGLFSRHLNQYFLPVLSQRLAEITEMAITAPRILEHIKEFIGTPYSEPERLLKLFASMIREFNPDIADRYETFVANSLRPIARPRLTLAS